MRQVTYGYRKVLKGVDFATGYQRTVEALKTEGFGIISEIDVQATMKAKLGIDQPAYKILGACNPSLAHQAMTAEPEIGLLLPCNVVVAAVDGGTEVQFAKPREMFKIVANAALETLADDVDGRLQRALERV